MSEREMYHNQEPRRGPSLLAIILAILLLGILVVIVIGVLALREAAQAVEGAPIASASGAPS